MLNVKLLYTSFYNIVFRILQIVHLGSQCGHIPTLYSSSCIYPKVLGFKVKQQTSQSLHPAQPQGLFQLPSPSPAVYPSTYNTALSLRPLSHETSPRLCKSSSSPSHLSTQRSSLTLLLCDISIFII